MALLTLASKIYGFFLNAKNKSFDQGARTSLELKARTLSVGNLSMGGTGKTPVVDFLAKYFLKKEMKVAIVARAYKAEAKRPVRVALEQPEACDLYGDEPCLLQTLNSKARVYVGEDKAEVAQFAEADYQPDIILVDDGFQHRKLARHFDLVLIDATESVANAQLFPKGRMREGFESLARADLVLLTKCNLTSPELLQFWIEKIGSTTCFRTDYITTRLSSLSDFDKEGAELNVSNSKPQSSKTLVGLVSALAKNAVFRKSVEDNFKFDIGAHFEFSDHHNYCNADLQKIEVEARRLGLEALILTTKDAIKVRKLSAIGIPIWVVHVDLQFQNQLEESFYAQVAHLFV